jgi:hypothetical protein
MTYRCDFNDQILPSDQPRMCLVRQPGWIGTSKLGAEERMCCGSATDIDFDGFRGIITRKHARSGYRWTHRKFQRLAFGIQRIDHKS